MTHQERVALVDLVVDPDTTRTAHAAGRHAWALQAHEVLEHVRIPYRTLDRPTPSATSRVQLIAAGTPTATELSELETWVREGGTLIVADAQPAWAELAGVDHGPATNGLVEFTPHPDWTHLPAHALRAVAGVGLTPVGDTETLAHWSGHAGIDQAGVDHGAAITSRTLDAGRVITFGVGLWETLVRIVQGSPVHTDGAPASDGSAPIDEGILKAEDGMALSLEEDRRVPTGHPAPSVPYDYTWPPPQAAPIFDLPQADLWWSALVQLIWAGLDRAQSPHGWLHYWPAGVPAMAHMSHDSDGNRDEEGQAAIDAFAAAGVRATWCQVFRDNGYSPHIYEQLDRAGHEHALHYNAMGDFDIAQWGWPQMRAQYAWAQAITGNEHIVSNKNHYTRWEGWTEFYVWCEKLGIKIDESRGPSKIGSVGFPFGTAHLSFPMGDVDVANRRMDVINLPLHTQDLNWAGHISCRDVIIDQALEVHGVAHFLYHGPHLLKPLTRDSCPELADIARAKGMLWWTAGEINNWERARRQVTIAVTGVDGGWEVELSSTAPLADAGVVVHLPGAVDPSCDDAAIAEVTRHGRTFHELTVTIGKGATRLQVRNGAA
ncbi:hypothetical protein ACQBAR_01785 [Propionibacteriaceae bacterium Y1685]|uniref:hypothetical protein n=1 Tax=Microlunatus sp. Y1700 TaxID=3418487 RepID=UPI003B76819B